MAKKRKRRLTYGQEVAIGAGAIIVPTISGMTIGAVTGGSIGGIVGGLWGTVGSALAVPVVATVLSKRSKKKR